MTKPTMNIVINDNGSVEITSDNKGVKSVKLVPLQYFLSTFATNYASFETPIMPNFCRKIIKSSNAELYLFEYPATYRNFKYDGHEIKNVFCPRTIFVAKVIGEGVSKQLVKACMWVADSLTPFSLTMPLYGWYCNNYSPSFHGASICWGSGKSTLDRILASDPSTYGSIFNHYMSLTFNEHLQPQVSLTAFANSFPHKKDTVGGGDQMLQILRYLEDEKIFPTNATSKTPHTLAQICADFNSGTF